MRELRTGAYLIPYTITGATVRIAHLRFPKGLGLIGGGIEGQEQIEEALGREIAEELSCEDKLFEVTNAVRLEAIYEFKNTSPTARATTERHHFWTLKLPYEMTLLSNTPNALVEWGNIQDFINSSPHQTFRVFCIKSILPVLVR